MSLSQKRYKHYTNDSIHELNLDEAVSRIDFLTETEDFYLEKIKELENEIIEIPQRISDVEEEKQRLEHKYTGMAFNTRDQEHKRQQVKSEIQKIKTTNLPELNKELKQKNQHKEHIINKLKAILIEKDITEKHVLALEEQKAKQIEEEGEEFIKVKSEKKYLNEYAEINTTLDIPIQLVYNAYDQIEKFNDLFVQEQIQSLKKTLFKSIKQKEIIKSSFGKSVTIQKKITKYEQANQFAYREFMTQLRDIPGYIKIVSQNMHCRQHADVGGDTCTGEKKFSDNQIQRAQQLAIQIVKHGLGGADVIAIQELQMQEAKEAFVDELETRDTTRKYNYWFPLFTAKVSYTVKEVEAYSGQGFIWDSTKVTATNRKFIPFPSDISSGADAAWQAKSGSFKGIAFMNFETNSGNKFCVFNIHPSPYVKLDKIGYSYLLPHATKDIEIVSAHLYQFTVTAMKIKEMITNGTIHSDDTIFICGDWNVNKYFQNGMGIGVREDVKGEAKKEPIFMRGYQTLKKRGGTKKVKVEGFQQCFRDDVPFTGNPKCDFAAGPGSEFLTCSEIIGSLPPTHLYSLSEADWDVPPPFGGKYTWDGMFNSVMYSPMWSEPAFQMLDHINYCKYGKIPSYAHIMTKRFLTHEPVLVNEGPLSLGCRTTIEYYNNSTPNIEIKEIPDNLLFYSKENNEGIREAQYIDFADHYAVECVAILSKNSTTIDNINTAVKNFYPTAKIWYDGFLPIIKKEHGTLNIPDAVKPKLWSFVNDSDFYKLMKQRKYKLSSKANDRSDIIAEHVKRADTPIDLANKFREIKTINNYETINNYVIKVANRLLEREYMNQLFAKKSFRFDIFKQIEESLSTGYFNCEPSGRFKTTKKKTLFDCTIAKSASNANTKKRRRQKIQQLDRGDFVSLQKAFANSASLKSPNIVGNYENPKESVLIATPNNIAIERIPAEQENSEANNLHDGGSYSKNSFNINTGRSGISALTHLLKEAAMSLESNKSSRTTRRHTRKIKY